MEDFLCFLFYIINIINQTCHNTVIFHKYNLLTFRNNKKMNKKGTCGQLSCFFLAQFNHELILNGS